jgi:hypothetical protein
VRMWGMIGIESCSRIDKAILRFFHRIKIIQLLSDRATKK